jgi:hypothetical protein
LRRDKALHIHFLRSPVEVLDGEGHAAGVKLERTRLEPAAGGSGQKARGTGVSPVVAVQLRLGAGHAKGVPGLGLTQTARCVDVLCHAVPAALASTPPRAGEFETIPADLVLKSIGFKSVGIPGAAFDPQAGVVPNKLGQVGPGMIKREPAGTMLTAATSRSAGELMSISLVCHKIACSPCAFVPPVLGPLAGRCMRRVAKLLTRGSTSAAG